jgi:Leucine-rich repeat (LRR) protein
VLPPCVDATAACDAPSDVAWRWRSVHGAGRDEVFISRDDINATTDVGSGKTFRVAVHAWSRHGATFTIRAFEVQASRALAAPQKTALDALFDKCCADASTTCNENWRTYRTNGTDPCHAPFGVRCAASGEIVELDLSGEAMACELRAADFAAFGSSLERLNLRNNRNVTLPGESSTFGVLGALTNLKSIDVSFTSLAYARALDDLCAGASASLIEITATATNIQGAVPACVLAMPNLQTINLAHNYLNGTLPDLPLATPMRYVSLGTQYSTTAITGSIPSSYASSPTLEFLFLNNLALSGSIPDSFANSRLRELSLKANNLTGVIPSSLAAEPYLLSIDLSGNNLSGEVPAGLYDNPNRTYVDLSGNALTKLSVTSAHANPGASLEYLNAAYNDIDERGVPETLTTLSGLKVLLLFKNHLHGPMLSATTTPTWDLRYLDASYNELSGDVPDATHFGRIFTGGSGWWGDNALGLSRNAFTNAPEWVEDYANVRNLRVGFMNNPVACPLPTSLIGRDVLAINCDFGENQGSPASNGVELYIEDDSSQEVSSKTGRTPLNGGMLAIVMVLIALGMSSGVGVGILMYRKRAIRRAVAFRPFQDVEMTTSGY